MTRPMYFDYAATTPMDARVIDAMQGFLSLEGEFGNPSSRQHSYGQAASRAIAHASSQLAELIGAEPETIIWTSGATESINLALKGAAKFYHRRGKHIVTIASEHNATLDTCRYLESVGYEVSYLQPNADGLVDLQALAETIRADTVMVSIMHVNNETGVIQDIAAIAAIAAAQGVILHVDAAQSLGRVDIDLKSLPVQLMSFSGHKIYGPKGIGALYVRQNPRVHLEPLIHGGNHQRGLRSGTLATHQIVGMGMACEILSNEMLAEQRRLRLLKDDFITALVDSEKVLLNGSLENSVANIINLSFMQKPADEFMMTIPEVAVSTGAACASAQLSPSHVLQSMGFDQQRMLTAIRFSIGRWSTVEQLAEVVRLIREKVLA